MATCNFQLVAPVGKPGEFWQIGSGYGSRIDPITGATGDWHSGIDIPAPAMTPVRAAMDGTVLKSYFSQTGGNTIWLNHGNGVQTRYMHLFLPSLYEEGAFVRAGTQISSVGSTGNSTGNHLHFEIRVNDKNIDPTECYNNALTSYVNPYQVPADYTGATADYTAPPPPSNGGKFPWWLVFLGVGVGGAILIATSNDRENTKPKRKRRKSK